MLLFRDYFVTPCALANWGNFCNRIRQLSAASGLRCYLYQSYAAEMPTLPSGTLSVIFVAQRTDRDDDGYDRAAADMDRLAAAQPGYIGMDSVRGHNGLGITVSYWADDAAAKAWRDHPEHVAIRDAGRDRWYSEYSLHVAQVTRSYDWQKS